MPRLTCLLPLLAVGLQAQIAPRTDFGVPRTYREDFDRLVTDGHYMEAEANARLVLARAEIHMIRNPWRRPSPWTC